MNRRQKNKYLKRDVPCAHGNTIMAYYGDIATYCKVSNKDGSMPCDGICKRYKSQYLIKYKESKL